MVEPRVTVPLYGVEKHWSRPNERNARELKDQLFTESADVCPRIERALIKDREGLFGAALVHKKALEKREN